MKTHHIQQAIITACIWALILSVESKSAIFAYGTQADQLAGIQFAAITLLGAVLAALGFTLVGQKKADERPEQRRGTIWVRLIAVTFLMFPVWFFGSSVKLHNDQVEWDARYETPAYAADVAMAAQANLSMSDRTAADYEIAEAAERTVRPVNANLSPLDGEFWFALILLGLLNFAAEKFRVPAPITAEERLALMYKARGVKAAKTRRERAAKREAAKKAKEQKGFGLVFGGKK